MKKIKILIITIVAIAFSIIYLYMFYPQNYGYNNLMKTPTTIRFKQDTLDLGTLLYNSEKQVVFQFTNTGSVPLLISNIRSSCDCTSIKWEKRPVNPGKTGEIKVIMKPNSLGMFLKTLEVHCNTLEQVVYLKLRGNIIENRIL